MAKRGRKISGLKASHLKKAGRKGRRKGGRKHSSIKA
jgi:hypothetical protein